MFDLLYFIPAFPLAGFLILGLRGALFPRPAVAAIGTGSVGLSALFATLIAITFFIAPPQDNIFTLKLWTWMEFDGYAPSFSLTLDPLSVVMILVITIVSFLIHLYSTEFMKQDEGYSRFFAYMNLFTASMLVLVLADNLLLLYLGWEGVGLCSYLLIGFWYTDANNGAAARKAFIVTRIGDTAMLLGIFLLFANFKTLDIPALLHTASTVWQSPNQTAVLAAALLLAGALGKSAQLPLQTWLPDAMAGPTPVSALIHAATMVTAGVYLIARLHVLFELAPPVMLAIAIIGAITALVAATSALAQTDLKRILAYSTISQIGYMFLALGVGAWSAAIFHFITHAFFKALLFLAAGAIILALGHEQNIFKMGGLRKRLPGTFLSFIAGAASLSAFPLVTAGFYSKEDILWRVWTSAPAGLWLWVAGTMGAFITSFYAFRMVFVIFYGTQHREIVRRPGFRMAVPVMLLAVAAIFGGFIELPRTLGDAPVLSDFLQPVFKEQTSRFQAGQGILQFGASLVSLSGIFMALLFYVIRPRYAETFRAVPFFSFLESFFLQGWKFDALYQALIVKPFLWMVRINRNDAINMVYTGVVAVTKTLHIFFSKTQTGNLRWYAMGIVAGAIIGMGIISMVK